ncbi:bifunctional diguanylate cyclase/phosphodiesterase [Rhodoferax sp. PAMC 29310]|uniref:sensor domain-containing protein n=1 Tax=Rhodoferax sp. PAMC 29310 TaxID=2822760 RepID=UPI001F0B4C0A|nr:bifunctional diguanylate cyclase/phosphodiesterase [Rhodoferax sp. PAMC 29310]
MRPLDVPLTRSDGVTLVLQLNVSRIDRAGTTYLLSYLEDVTSKRSAEVALLANEQLLKAANNRLNRQVALFGALQSLASVRYWTYDAQLQDLQWSNGLSWLAGLAPGTVKNAEVGRRRIHPDDRARFEAAREALDGTMIQYRWQHPDGRIRWLRSQMLRWPGSEGDAAIDFGVIQDITDEWEAGLALEGKLAFIQQITHRVPGVIFQFRLDSLGHSAFLFISDHVQSLYRGISREEAMEDPTCILKPIHPEDRKLFLAAIQTSAKTLSVVNVEFRLLFEDGKVRWLLGQAIPECESDGSILWSGFASDITQRKLAEEELRNSEGRFRALTELSSDWYWEQDDLFRLTRLEGAAQAFSQLPTESYLGLTRWEVGSENLSQGQWTEHRATLEAHQTFHDFEFLRTGRDGTLLWVSLSGAPIFDDEGQFKGYRGIGRDISERKRVEQTVEQLAFYDPLTSLPNRRLLLDRLQQALVSSGREGEIGALLFIDLDNFKDLNDTQGHDVGDLLLQQVAQRLLGSVRETDTVARFGGDEFVIMLQGLGGDMLAATAQIERVGRKLLTQLNEPYLLRQFEHHSTPSVGVTLFQGNRKTVDELLKQADLAMYESKAAGRNTLRFFDPEMQALVAARTELESDLRLGLQRQQLVLFYQPVVNEMGGTVGVEALVRWQHPQRGMVSPVDFIPMAEQTGLILPLGRWVLEAACQQLVVWSEQAMTRDLTIAVNVSARQFKHPEFVQQVKALLATSGANPQRLKLELTESLLLGDIQDAILRMTELKTIGISFALDDFGTGYSSLSYLKLLPLTQLKIDQSFVRDVMTDPNDAAIARTVLTLGHSLGLTVVAEGVETEAQRAFLAQHGCRLFQGYLFGRPVLIDQLRLTPTSGIGSAD